VVRAEDSKREAFRRVLSECVSRLEPLAETDKMRWRDLLWILVSWALQRRPDAERDEMTAAVVASQRNASTKEEATAVIDVSKETTVQRAGRLALVEGLRDTLIDALSAAFGELPQEKLSSIRACDDATKLRQAIVRVRDMKSLDEFQL
jgi:hypothetical protein